MKYLLIVLFVILQLTCFSYPKFKTRCTHIIINNNTLNKDKFRRALLIYPSGSKIDKDLKFRFEAIQINKSDYCLFVKYVKSHQWAENDNSDTCHECYSISLYNNDSLIVKYDLAKGNDCKVFMKELIQYLSQYGKDSILLPALKDYMSDCISR